MRGLIRRQRVSSDKGTLDDPEIRDPTMAAGRYRRSRRRWFLLDGTDASQSCRPGCGRRQGGRATHAYSLVDALTQRTKALQAPVEGATAEAERSRGSRLVAL